jgi:hypothetical protein
MSSRNGTSIANTSPVRGALNTAEMPAAPPATRRTFASSASNRRPSRDWTTSPSVPPVSRLGPSSPMLPPSPIVAMPAAIFAGSSSRRILERRSWNTRMYSSAVAELRVRERRTTATLIATPMPGASASAHSGHPSTAGHVASRIAHWKATTTSPTAAPSTAATPIQIARRDDERRNRIRSIAVDTPRIRRGPR